MSMSSNVSEGATSNSSRSGAAGRKIENSRSERIAAFFNFSGIEQPDYTVEIPDAARIRRIFTSEWKGYGGTEETNDKILTGEDGIFELSMKPSQRSII